ncbi:hypothetical protein DFH06DRAFT_1351650 [Mycena polygramma]|nr:hypothetical protein DFH06DRAFT_1351650 [Mycena polygramma]
MLDIRPLPLLLSLEVPESSASRHWHLRPSGTLLSTRRWLSLPCRRPHHFFIRSPTSSAFPGRLGILFARCFFDINHDQRTRTSVNQALYKLFWAPLSSRSFTNASAFFLNWTSSTYLYPFCFKISWTYRSRCSLTISHKPIAHTRLQFVSLDLKDSVCNSRYSIFERVVTIEGGNGYRVVMGPVTSYPSFASPVLFTVTDPTLERWDYLHIVHIARDSIR